MNATIIKECLNCGAPFSNSSRRKRTNFCSAVCRRTISADKKFENACWEWGGRINDGGYGFVMFKGRYVMAHRKAWERHNGPIPEGLVVCHKCDNRRCINPHHMFLGTDADNVADMDAKGRRVVLRGSKNGTAKLNEESVLKVKALLRDGSGLPEIAERFGVSVSTISLINSGKNLASCCLPIIQF